LHYASGKLQRAVSRGDGVSGEDITENVRSLSVAPEEAPSLKVVYTNSASGEAILIDLKQFEVRGTYLLFAKS
jgi:NAD-dependent DNA ligase